MPAVGASSSSYNPSLNPITFPCHPNLQIKSLHLASTIHGPTFLCPPSSKSTYHPFQLYQHPLNIFKHQISSSHFMGTDSSTMPNPLRSTPAYLSFHQHLQLSRNIRTFGSGPAINRVLSLCEMRGVLGYLDLEKRADHSIRIPRRCSAWCMPKLVLSRCLHVRPPFHPRFPSPITTITHPFTPHIYLNNIDSHLHPPCSIPARRSLRVLRDAR